MSDNYQAVYEAVRSRFHGCDVEGAIQSVLRDSFGMAHHLMSCVAQDYSVAAAEQARPVVVFKPTLSRDGNQWCFLFGESLAEGVAGFGDTPALAATDFDKQWLSATMRHSTNRGQTSDE
jgi:hypothetical protein